MATEITILKVKDHVTADNFVGILDHSRLPAGLLSIGWKGGIEDNSLRIGFANWESVQAHVDFTKVPAFSAVATALKELCAAPANVFHTHIQPFPPTELYQAVVVELAVLAKKPDVSLDQFNKISEVFFERVQKQPGYRCHFRGIKHEDNNVHIHFVGWDSVESYNASRSGEAGVDQLQAVESYIDKDESFVYRLKA